MMKMVIIVIIIIIIIIIIVIKAVAGEKQEMQCNALLQQLCSS